MMKGWANLPDGPAGLIADLLLAHDVADYIRFRAACSWWCRCAPDPRTPDRRFHPRRWVMLRERRRERLPDHYLRRRFLNVSTSECIQVDLPELAGHEVLAVTPEGLLVLLRRRKDVRLLNPLTRHLTELPPVTTLLPLKDHYMLSYRNRNFEGHFAAWGSGIADDDDSTVVLCFRDLHMFGVAKPGDQAWTPLDFGEMMSPLRHKTPSVMFAGRFYCVSNGAVLVLETNPPRFDVAAKFDFRISTGKSAHLVDNGGDLMLVHRKHSPVAGNQFRMIYNVYRVDRDTRTLFPVNSLGGRHALFMGRRCSLSVPIEAFPSGSISADTIYLTKIKAEGSKGTRAYHLPDRSITPAACYNLDGSVAQPHTLVDCLALCTAVEYQDD